MPTSTETCESDGRCPKTDRRDAVARISAAGNCNSYEAVCVDRAKTPTDSGSYQDIGLEIGALVCSKQAAYGDSFGESGAVMRILYPDGVRPDQLDDALTIVRVLDKLFRIATDKDAFGEDPYRDIAGYCILAIRRRRP